MKIDDVVTYVGNKEDLPFLKTKLFDVNMRLFKSSIEYRNLIEHCCQVIRNRCRPTYEDYKKPHGMSGANCAIPFNIIAIVLKRNTADEHIQIMINPVIEEYGQLTEMTETNCGSIRLKNPISVKRANRILVKWYSMSGDLERGQFSRSSSSFTIQHEVDHNLGILITDKQYDNNK